MKKKRRRENQRRARGLGFIFIWFYLSYFSPPSPRSRPNFPSLSRLGLEAGRGIGALPAPSSGGSGTATSQPLRGQRGCARACPGCHRCLPLAPCPPELCPARPGGMRDGWQSQGCASRSCLRARLELGGVRRVIPPRGRLGSCREAVPGGVPALLCAPMCSVPPLPG